ncbi:MAG: hypothetical protein P8100_14345 [bacterium]
MRNKKISRRNFLNHTGKTLFFGSVAAAAVPVFLEGCQKEKDCNLLKEGENDDLYCNDNYLCTEAQGFTCDPVGGFHCEVEGFSCYTVFDCLPENNFSCLPTSSYSNPVGGAGG